MKIGKTQVSSTTAHSIFPRHWLVKVHIALLLGVCTATSHSQAAAPLPTQTIIKFFSGPKGTLLPYTPFDGKLGLLRSAQVTVQGAFEFQMQVIPADPADPADPSPIPYNLRINHTLEASAYARGFGFSGGNTAGMQFQGVATPYMWFPQNRSFSVGFEVTPASDALGIVSVQTTGIEIPPAEIDTRLEYFINTHCDDFQSYESAISFSAPISLPMIVALAPPLGYTGYTQIVYAFIPTNQLQERIQNGDFEGSGFSPWIINGPGTGSLASPVECLQSTLNTLLELTAGSPVDVSQSVDTPTEAFELTFDYGFPQTDGQLDVWIGGTLIDQIAASSISPHTFRTRQLHLDDPALLGLQGVPIKFSWNASGGSKMWLDNISLVSVPEPGNVTLLTAAGMTLACLLLRRKRHDPTRKFT